MTMRSKGPRGKASDSSRCKPEKNRHTGLCRTDLRDFRESQGLPSDQLTPIVVVDTR